MFCRSTEDVALYRRLGADAIANKKVPTSSTSSSGETFYRVIAGSYKERVNAEKRKSELEAKGFTGVFLEAFKK